MEIEIDGLHVRQTQILEMVSKPEHHDIFLSLGEGLTLTMGELDHHLFQEQQCMVILEVTVTLREPREGEIT